MICIGLFLFEELRPELLRLLLRLPLLRLLLP
jgi:hypothetical protein